MATKYKILGQSAPDKNIIATLYQCPLNTQAIISTISICNRVPTQSYFRISVRPNSEILSNKHYIAYDNIIAGADNISITLGVTLNSLDIVEIFSKTSYLSFSCFGTEIS